MTAQFPSINTENIPTPSYVVDEEMLEYDGKILQKVEKEAGCKIILALKGFAGYGFFPTIRKYISGVCSGNLYETKLGAEEFKKEVHTYSPAFKDEEFPEVLELSDHIYFNSIAQYRKFLPIIKKSGKKVELALRVNPEKSVAEDMFGAYDPCFPNSRLGIKIKDIPQELEGITGLHFHALCRNGLGELKQVLEAFEEKFDKYIKKMSWVNFGGGHHITRDDYDVSGLISLIKNFKKKYPNIKDVYLEPGEAAVLNAGVIVASVIDIVHNQTPIAILDSSVETHIPDVMICSHSETPYREKVVDAEPILPGKKTKYSNIFTLAGESCAAGDIFGDYAFKNKLKVGDKIIFTDVAHYTLVKMSNFCGVPLPDIYLREKSGNLKLIRKSSYQDYKNRLS